VAVTPAAGTAPAAVARVSALWTGVGARVLPLDPAVHDERVARTSHLVHLAATVLADTVGREAGEDVAAFCGPGFRDTTRVASSSAEVWDDIVRTNADAILSETRAFRARLDGLIAALEKRDFEAVRRLLESGRARRECLLREAPGAAGGAR
jgi:prephenate dehydrogenase/3-phosphoshikimate 1-carboxyvinyltransferase